ncbi:interleukin-27 receptor subunit alpha isoform 2-T2 [Discoglossus pictus]
MSDTAFAEPPVREWLFFLLVMSSICTGIVEMCAFCCVPLSRDKGLNCTWKNISDSQTTVQLQSLKHHPDPSSRLFFEAPRSQNWVLIPRQMLTKYDQYEVKLEMKGRVHLLNLTYDGENVPLEPPMLSTEVHFIEEDDSVGVEVMWSHTPDIPQHQELELRYRRQGDNTWIEVDQSDMQRTACELFGLEPYTEYEVQIRYLPDEMQSMKGSHWSDSIHFKTPEEAPSGSIDVWRRNEKGSSLFIFWKPLDPQFARGDILSYEVEYFHQNKSHTLNVPCCYVKLPADSMHVCLRAQNSKGFGPSTCATPLCSELPFSEGIKAWGNQAGGISVSWRSPIKSHYDSPKYIVEWTEVTHPGNTELNWARTSTLHKYNITLPGQFAPYVPYRVSVSVMCNNSCSGPVSAIAYSLEGVPSAAPNFSIYLHASTNVLISWDEIPVWQQRGILTHYTVYLNNSDTTQRHTVYGRNLSLSGLLPRSAYNVWMTASTSAGEGPPGRVMIFYTSSFILPFLYVISSAIIIISMICLLCVICTKRRWCWKKIPKPQDHIVMLCNTAYSNVYLHNQISSNTPVTLVEEIEEPADHFQDPLINLSDDYPLAMLPQDPATLFSQEPSTVLSQEPSTVLSQKASTVLSQEPSTVLSQEAHTVLSLEPKTVWPPRQTMNFSGYEKHFMPSKEEVTATAELSTIYDCNEVDINMKNADICA